jgi:ABC-type multidrug transport system ATPase subunit
MASVELELDGLRRMYGAVTALDGLSFGVPAGQVFGFPGPDGAGKTTAMRAIFGVTALDAGEIRWRGKPAGEQERRRFGYMPEERGLYPAMKLRDQIARGYRHAHPQDFRILTSERVRLIEAGSLGGAGSAGFLLRGILGRHRNGGPGYWPFRYAR